MRWNSYYYLNFYYNYNKVSRTVFIRLVLNNVYMNNFIFINTNNFKCKECGNTELIKIDNNIICSKCGLVINMPYPYIAGKKVNSRYMKKPIKTKSKGQPAYYKREITEYRHNIPDYKIIFINRKPKLIAY